jgi:alkanesulfonate monooxygenase SsuD/methylene tetrahydromethanopterin reductase-like flavin-dependent oxidoreductase (luciferase family)
VIRFALDGNPREEAAMGHGFALYAGVAPEIIRATAREAEALGYSSFWVNHPGPVDGLGALAHAARDTARIALGIGVIPLHTRGPESIADGVRAHALPLDRLLLGVGSPNPDSLKRVREGVASLRSRLSTRLVVAALGPRMCRLAGEVADGVLFNWLTPEHARASAEEVRAGAAAAGRPVPTLYAYVRLAVGAASAAKLAEEGDRYGAIPAYAANFARMGVKPVDTAISATEAAAVPAQLARWRGAVDEVVLRAITAKDTVEDNLALLRAARPAAEPKPVGRVRRRSIGARGTSAAVVSARHLLAVVSGCRAIVSARPRRAGSAPRACSPRGSRRPRSWRAARRASSDRRSPPSPSGARRPGGSPRRAA